MLLFCVTLISSDRSVTEANIESLYQGANKIFPDEKWAGV